MYEELKKIIGESKRMVFFGGAGVSTESGVPDFRSGDGLYRAKKQFGRSPEEIISHSFFLQDPDTFFHYYKHNLIYPDAVPNKAHLALAKWEAEGILTGVITQNIDGLHQMAKSRRICELHGSVQKNTCMKCGAHYDLNYVMDPAHCMDQQGRQTWIPYCKKCGGIVKPDVVLYEECLDDRVLTEAVQTVARGDTLIVGGTSLVVYPAAGLLQYFQGNHLVLINQSATSYDQQAELVIREPIGQVLGECAGL